MSVTALKNQRERNRKTARPRFWEDDEVRAVRRKESKIFGKRFERLSPVFSKTILEYKVGILLQRWFHLQTKPGFSLVLIKC